MGESQDLGLSHSSLQGPDTYVKYKTSSYLIQDFQNQAPIILETRRPSLAGSDRQHVRSGVGTDDNHWLAIMAAIG